MKKQGAETTRSQAHGEFTAPWEHLLPEASSPPETGSGSVGVGVFSVAVHLCLNSSVPLRYSDRSRASRRVEKGI